MTMPTIEAIADNAWLKILGRLALPFIGAVLWQQYNSLNAIEKTLPVLELRVDSLEKDDATRATVELRLDNIRSAQESRITILEQKFDFIQQSLQRIERATVPPPRP